ncbi:MAG: hypothetical protein E6J90_46645 [Deltaproteobacteria bacterium]|nr:MAG: hypothetical protein E6J91_41480 [Deltaproteobacteria bacterium]TMQ06345.1 MAG: hypothetical protein E6J90_46645 [Deltaproteobacteria bacterium]
MTRPSPPPPDRQFVRDVARQVDRRRVRRRMTLWSALLGLVAAAALYLRCGGGLGMLGLGPGGADDDAPRSLTGPRSRTIRMSASGLSVDGRALSRDEAIAACKDAPGVDVYWTGDVRHGDPEELRAALAAAGAQHIVLHPLPRPARPPSN